MGTEAGAGFPEGSSVGMFGRHRLPKVDFKTVTDGLTNTIMVGETLPSECIYISAFAPNYTVFRTGIPINTHVEERDRVDWRRACGFKSSHPGGAHFLMGDASIQVITEAIDFRLFNDLGTRAGSEIAKLP